MFKRKNTTLLAASALATALAALAVGPTARAGTLPISSCGQTVTKSAVLTKDLDCAGTSGIVVGADGITIDLKGHTLKGDRLAGHHGVLDPGFDKVTVKNGVVRNFDDGVFVIDHAVSVAVSNIVATGNTGYGVAVVGTTAKIASSTVAGNGKSGLYVEGGSASVTSSTAVGNSDFGIFLWGALPSVKSSKASGNGDQGIYLDGDSATITSATANGNSQTGIGVLGDFASVRSSTASGNGGSGISVSGGAAVLTGNRAEANGFAGGVSDGAGIGISAGGSPTPAGTKNVARGNDDPAGCSPSSLCPAVGSNPKGAPITSCGQFVSVNAYLAQDLDCPGVSGVVVVGSGVTIDLNGHALTGNAVPGHYGLYVVGTSDHVTIKNGVVRNFENGILAVHSSKLTVSNVVAVGNMDRGITGYVYAGKIESSTAARNGGTGIGLDADKTSVISSTLVGNGLNGIGIEGSANSVKSSTAVANTPSGIRLDGTSVSVASSTVFGNVPYGVYVDAAGVTVKSTAAIGNASFGMAVFGDSATLSGNQANGNGLPGGVSDGLGMGIFVGSYVTAPTGTNVALGNDDPAGCNPSALCRAH